MTPNVITENKIVYCHNPAPFYKVTWKEAMTEKSLIFFKLFYNFFYRINIHSNKYVVVQQQWMREAFQKKYKIKNVIVSYPDVPINNGIEKKDFEEKKPYSFFYPSLPRVFKNFETLLRAAKILENQSYKFEVILTFDGSENSYASQLVKKYSHLKSVQFIGLQKRETLLQLYNETSCLVFTSTMETWGLPITEMKLFDKPIIVAKCKYAYETVGNYDKACFFEPRNALQLSELMKKALTGNLEFSYSNFFQPQQPFAKSWKDLFALILQGNK
jgi:glycosyltransferase involved in cell wall biosynthesis